MSTQTRLNDMFSGGAFKSHQIKKPTKAEREARSSARRTAASIRYGIPVEDVDAYQRVNESPVYKRLQEILYAYIIFVLGNALILAADVAFGVDILKQNEIAQALDFVSMAFGLIMTALFIHAVYKGLKFGVFEGFQKKMAQLFLLIAFADESASLVAKFNATNAQLLDLYTSVILPITAPMICFFAMILILSEQIARRYRKVKESSIMLDHEKTMSAIQRKTEAIRAERRERTTREIAVAMHGMKLRLRSVCQSIWSGYAWDKAGSQSRNMIKSVVASSGYNSKESSGDGQASKDDLPELSVNTGGGTAKKGWRIFRRK